MEKDEVKLEKENKKKKKTKDACHLADKLSRTFGDSALRCSQSAVMGT